jgi:PAS domain S-box-containing protein
MQKVWESITDGLYVLNSNWEFTFVNKESERILRHPKEELLGKKAWDFFPNAKNLKLYHEYHRAVAEKVSVHFEEYVPTYDLWASINAYPTSEGLVVYLLDITAQKKAGEKLQNEQEKLRAIINNTQDIIWSIDKNMQIIDANKPFWDYIYAMTGKTQQEVTESDFSKDLMKSWEGYLQPAFEGKAYRSTIKNETDGHITYSEINFSPIYDKDKNIVGVSCFSRDITEERQHQEMVEHQNRQLKEIAWLQSHKVRNHVTTIQGLAQLFNHNDPNDPTNKQILDGIQATTAELDHVIKEINSKAQKLGE